MSVISTEEIINKSLNEIDDLANLAKSLEQPDELAKSEVPPQDISDDTPSQEGEGAGEEPSGEEGVGEEPTGEEGAGDVPDDTDEVPHGEEEFGKSLAEELNEDDNVRKALEVSEFLEALVKGISDRLIQHDDSITKSLQGADKSGELLAKSLGGIVQTQKAVVQSQVNLSKSIAELTNRLNKVEHAPMVRKSVATSKEHVIEKSFANTPAKNNDTLSKSEAVEKLTIECANRPELVQDVLALESTGDFNTLSPLAKSFLSSK